MKQKETSNEIYDISALLDEELGKEGTPERERNREKAWEEYNAQILMDARKNAHLTQAELARRIGADKSYISRIERGLTVSYRRHTLQDSRRNGNDGRIAPNLTIINHGRGEVRSPEDIRCRCIRAGRPRPYDLSHNRLDHLNPHPQGVHSMCMTFHLAIQFFLQRVQRGGRHTSQNEFLPFTISHSDIQCQRTASARRYQ